MRRATGDALNTNVEVLSLKTDLYRPNLVQIWIALRTQTKSNLFSISIDALVHILLFTIGQHGLTLNRLSFLLRCLLQVYFCITICGNNKKYI